MLRFVGVAQSPAAPINTRTKGYSPIFPPRIIHSYLRKKRHGRSWHLPKIALLMGKDFGLKSFDREVVQGKKMLFHIFFEVLMVG